MVLINVSKGRERVHIILLPDGPIHEFLNKHVHRNKLEDGTTCIVTKDRNWTGIPRHITVIRKLVDSLSRRPMREGELPYRADDLKCRTFNKEGFPTDEVFNGDFMVNANAMEIRGRDHAMKEVIRYESFRFWDFFNVFTRNKVNRTFRDLKDDPKKRVIWLVRHVHPVRKKFL
jgi:hypothetical protein